MINVVIIEDEAPARRKLNRFLEEVNEKVTVISELTTVEEAISFFRTAPEIDLILSDIELLDGNAFGIYSEVKITCPIIFTTAYNQFLMDAFESNGIDYLLKPFSVTRFQKAWDKFLRLRHSGREQTEFTATLNQLLNSFQADNISFKKRFAVNTAKETYFIETSQIQYFKAEDGVVMAIDQNNKNHLLAAATLKSVEDQLNPEDFFRINRSEIVHKLFVESIERYNKNTLAVKLKHQKNHLITSQQTTALFRHWIEQ